LKSNTACCRLGVEVGEKGDTCSAAGEERDEVLPLEVTGLLGLLYAFFFVGTLKALQANSSVRRTAKTREKTGLGSWHDSRRTARCSSAGQGRIA
jgi:hypothetical protein